MVFFEVTVNGELRFGGDDVTAVTLAADWVARRKADRVSLHVGVRDAGERQVQYLGADLGPGDEILIRVLRDEDASTEGGAPESCSFCGNGMYEILSLVSGSQVAICNSCLASFDAVVAHGAPLPVGASLRDKGDAKCGFCQKGPRKSRACSSGTRAPSAQSAFGPVST